MASYDNQYNMSIKPATPNLRGISDTYDNTGTNKVSNMGLGDLYELDYDRNKIEQVFNQGTDAQYALMQKENRIAENQYANNQFASQQSAIESLRQQRNSQIASGMARGLNAAQEQGTILGVQQNAAAGALELANQRQLEADKIAAEYANNVVKALQEANSVKQAMAQVGAQLYEADMLGYTGELSAAAQMDANAVNKYGYELGLEGTQYTANKNYDAAEFTANRNYDAAEYTANKNLEGVEFTANRNYDAAEYTANRNYDAAEFTANRNYDAAEYTANKNLEGTIYNANRNYDAAEYTANKNYDASVKAANIQAAATKAAAATQAAATKYAASLQNKGVDYQTIIDKNTKNGVTDWAAVKGDLVGNGLTSEQAVGLVNDTKVSATTQQKGITSINNTDQWIKALDGNNNAGKALGLGDSVQGQYKNADVKAVVAEAQRQINNGSYTYKNNATLYADMKNGTFGSLRSGL